MAVFFSDFGYDLCFVGDCNKKTVEEDNLFLCLFKRSSSNIEPHVFNSTAIESSKKKFTRPVETIKFNAVDDRMLLEFMRKTDSRNYSECTRNLFDGRYTVNQVKKRFLYIYNRNNSGLWSSDEIARLNAICDKKNMKDIGWVNVSDHVRSRSPVQCRFHYFKYSHSAKKNKIK